VLTVEDKTFELLTKMYSDFSKRFDNMENRLDNLENGQRKLEDGQRKLETLIENDIKSDIKALYDGYHLTYEKLEAIERKVDDISVKVEMHEVEIKVIKGGKA
jgi:predicted phage-related endonuclease